MSEGGVLLLARAAGRDFLLSASDLLEVLPAGQVTPLPGPLSGIAGVILYGGEFLPVVDWGTLSKGGNGVVWATTMAILRRHLALPLEVLSGAMEGGPPGPRVEPPEDDPWLPFVACVYLIEGVALPLLDPDKLVDGLHRRRAEP